MDTLDNITLLQGNTLDNCEVVGRTGTIVIVRLTASNKLPIYIKSDVFKLAWVMLHKENPEHTKHEFMVKAQALRDSIPQLFID
jgi:hypothetical protein